MVLVEETRRRLGHDHLLDLSSTHHDVHGEDSGLALLEDTGRSLFEGYHAALGEDETGPHHGVAREGKLEIGREDAKPEARLEVGRREHERRLGERFISFAIDCISSLVSPSASGKMARGLPVKGRSVKTSA
jgi:hypothetical protein